MDASLCIYMYMYFVLKTNVAPTPIDRVITLPKRTGICVKYPVTKRTLPYLKQTFKTNFVRKK